MVYESNAAIADLFMREEPTLRAAHDRAERWMNHCRNDRVMACRYAGAAAIIRKRMMDKVNKETKATTDDPSDIAMQNILRRWESLCGGPSRLRDMPRSHWRMWMSEESERVRAVGAVGMADSMDRIISDLQDVVTSR